MPWTIPWPEAMTRDDATLEIRDLTGGNSDRDRCPVCEQAFFDWGPCEHVVSTLSYSDIDGGNYWSWDYLRRELQLDDEAVRVQFGNTSVIEALPEAVKALLERLPDADYEAGRLPGAASQRVRSRRLRALLESSVRERRFGGCEADRYLHDILGRCPTYLGWMTLHTDGPCSGSFEVHYALDAPEVAAQAVRVIAREVATVNRLLRATT